MDRSRSRSWPKRPKNRTGLDFQALNPSIPGGIQVKKRMIIVATFQVHFHHIPGHSRATPGPFQPHSGYIPAIFLVNSRSIPGGIGYVCLSLFLICDQYVDCDIILHDTTQTSTRGTITYWACRSDSA